MASEPRIPPEVWQQIFERSFIPPNLMDCCVHGGEDGLLSIVQEHKKNLMLVCKDWYRANKQYLYEHIDLKQPGHLLALSRSLKSWPEDGTLIKHLHTQCHVAVEWEERFMKKL